MARSRVRVPPQSSSRFPTLGPVGLLSNAPAPHRHRPLRLPLTQPSTSSSGTTMEAARAASSRVISKRLMRCAIRPSSTMGDVQILSLGGFAAAAESAFGLLVREGELLLVQAVGLAPLAPGGQQQPSSPLPSQHQAFAAGYVPQGYFAPGPAAYSAQYPAAPQAVTNDYAHAQNGAYQARSNTPGTNDPNVGLAHQFSHQNLGGATRSAGYGARGPSAGQRPRTAGAPGQPPASYGGYMNAPPMPSQSSPAAVHNFQQAPERNPDRYGPNSHSNQKKCSQLATDFFKDSVKRARERNQRQSELEQKLQDPGQSAARKEQLWSTAGRKEGQYLRFLRTKDKPENYNTVKIIGKGAFGEVKLVQKKGDGKVYAMKSLIKTEMFKKDQLAHVRSERDILAESDSPWVVKLYTTFQDTYFLYMLMEFLPGGDLMTMLIKYEIFSEDKQQQPQQQQQHLSWQQQRDEAWDRRTCPAWDQGRSWP
ncbi:Protein kinase-like domain protein [Ophiocordyceps sinensis CO18]|uniref:non-specific serine/threonine protein kinase n=1 Tax=Ophiocordyceps sinensis (strain Co18 / CGMCC 3.14243) TaxID=911162 RepID=T5AGF1_OPHSC|nr:Protein kinase-like domain protein [Ophiocordyceps sinensis CO18]